MSNVTTAAGLLNACIAEYVANRHASRSNMLTPYEGGYDGGMADMLVHMAMLVRGIERADAEEWLGEEIQDRIVSLAD